MRARWSYIHSVFIVPKLEWLFWGWLRCFLQYAFYEVIAAAVVYIIGNLILGVLQLQPAGTISTLQLIGCFPSSLSHSFPRSTSF